MQNVGEKRIFNLEPNVTLDLQFERPMQNFTVFSMTDAVSVYVTFGTKVPVIGGDEQNVLEGNLIGIDYSMETPCNCIHLLCASAATIQLIL